MSEHRNAREGFQDRGWVHVRAFHIEFDRILGELDQFLVVSRDRLERDEGM